MTLFLSVTFTFPQDIAKRDQFLAIENMPDKLEALAQGFATFGTNTPGMFGLAAQLEESEVEYYTNALGNLYTANGQKNFTLIRV